MRDLDLLAFSGLDRLLLGLGREDRAALRRRGCDGDRAPETGKREVLEHEAAVVRRVFAEFAAGASISSITNALNNERIAPRYGDEPDSAMQASLSTWRADAAVAAGFALAVHNDLCFFIINIMLFYFSYIVRDIIQQT